MTVKERLRACRSAQIRIATLYERRALYATLSTPSAHTPQSEPFCAHSQDKGTYYIQQLEELTEQIRELIVEEEAERQACMKLLSTLPTREYTVMWLYYCEGLTWEQVAKRTHYDRDNCMRIQRKALRLLAA